MKFILLLTCLIWADSDKRRSIYVDQYKEIAIVEMHRKGVPASIKLAQAILESRSGTSDFARSSNNHFGIKCKSYWKGRRYFHEDDDYDEKGTLLESCFRSYDRVMDSYIDHSNFLYYTSHYQKLFLIDRQDYKSWAYGLQKCGYATDPNYAKKLISIIEKEGLAKYDQL